ncbi:Translation initiation factor IF-1 [Candidatus Hodgkinia cicadicola]|uniref:Translation initiation factor IF-1 n=1 Tax=Candidatus Hodgkinia cicadicola TaxID=573658 RepID=A0ABX4MFQ3_9HYPH|nr:Translation initiation factor IF-1 [Candidatus Hodgkinia cicadicola]
MKLLPNYIFKVKLNSNNKIIISITTKLQLRRVKLLVIDKSLGSMSWKHRKNNLKYKL